MDNIKSVRRINRPNSFGFAIALVFLLLTISIVRAATTQYSYDSLGRLTQASQTGGSNSQYQYDASGNPTSNTLSNSGALSLSTPLNVNLITPGQSAALTFTATTGQSLNLNLAGISTTPAGGMVTISVYNPSGALISSTTGSTTATLNLINLSAGNYSVVIMPQSNTTVALQANLAAPAANAGTDADAPLPAWVMAVLGAGLLGTLRKFSGRRLGRSPHQRRK
jgi:YD repeat-containing protein